MSLPPGISSTVPPPSSGLKSMLQHVGQVSCESRYLAATYVKFKSKVVNRLLQSFVSASTTSCLSDS